MEMKTYVGIKDGKVVHNGMEIELPKHDGGISVTQTNRGLYVNGYEWTKNGWKRTIPAIFHYLF